MDLAHSHTQDEQQIGIFLQSNPMMLVIYKRRRMDRKKRDPMEIDRISFLFEFHEIRHTDEIFENVCQSSKALIKRMKENR